jgi:hypothetical protein
MKLRHAAALALVGWYLIRPPWKPDAHGFRHPVPEAPVAEWFFDQSDQGSWLTTRKHAKIFSSYRDCKKAIEERKRTSQAFKKLLDRGGKVPDWMFEGVENGDYIRSANSAQCIKSDDPRLAK